MVKPLWRTVWKFLKKLKIELTYDPALPLLDIHVEKTIRKDTCTPMSTAALFTITSSWEQPKRPSAEEQVRKMQHILTHAGGCCCCCCCQVASVVPDS